jgi:serine/threonine protein kinase
VLFCAASVLPLAFGYPEPPGMRWTALLILTSVLVTRAVLVPSGPLRTLWIGAACTAPVLLATRSLTIPAPIVEVPPVELPFVIHAALWALCGIALSTVTSAVIYGLRRRVDEARRLGQYTLEQKLGEGGMGAVYRARHAMLRRPTAVKLLPPERAGLHNLQRFEREVQTTAQLSHPNTVAIFDYGRTPDGVFYYAMEYLEGIDLDALVRGFGPQPPGRVVHILKQVAGALGEAHAVHLIHRDVKPANVILCSRGGAPDVAKVVDFGLVRDLAAGRQTTESALDLITGTPLYLSPEAITAPELVDGRSDLYALGAVGYFLLAGRNAFEGATVVEVCTHHLHTIPEQPSLRLGRRLPADLEAIVLSLLEKSPQRRPQSAVELVERLEACACAAEWSEHEAREWWKRNGGRVRELRSRPPAGGAPMATLAVSLEERLAGVGEGT